MFSNIRDMQVKNNQDLSDKPLQQIYYGAPGTGKSHTINEVTKGVSSDFVFRTTFHPDSDYSTFVGAYKPTMKKLPIYNSQNGDKIGEEEKIAYSFVAQSFLKAYVTAWQNREQSVYLVIEEINRGNCAQIFGDLFQLLDRNEEGVSEYPIKADQDIQDYLRDKFADCVGLPENIKSGDELLLPSNLYIWATMNTSDQSLFPIDSAFKRRWDWQYMPIKNAEKGWVIKVKDENGTKKYDWWEFIQKINAEIDDLTSSEDKKLGYFFCKPKDRVVSADMFVNKVMFYLWNDVVKDYDLSGREAFQDNDGKVLTFGKFYENKVRAIEKLMENLGVNEINDENNNASASDADASVGVFAVNGESFKVLGDVVYRAVELFVNNNPTMKDIDVANAWKQIKGTGTGFKYLVETAAEHDARKAISTDSRFDSRAKVLTTPMSEILYVSTEWTKEMVSNFMDQVNAQGWEITITKVAE
ncbi:MAG: AAA family ATPase [Paludibacteraceae bacterium]|nr:AAA family ATPase [Paludibacteraceae bacterium]